MENSKFDNAFVEFLEQTQLPDSATDDVHASRAFLIKRKYERQIVERMRTNGGLTDKQYHRLYIAFESITAIYKQILTEANGYDDEN